MGISMPGSATPRPSASRAVAITGAGALQFNTAGNNFGYGDFNITRDINKGLKPGPWIDATAPYLDGAGATPQVHELRDAADAESMQPWADAGRVVQGVHQHPRAELGRRSPPPTRGFDHSHLLVTLR
jgi:hypothetical protein